MGQCCQVTIAATTIPVLSYPYQIKSVHLKFIDLINVNLNLSWIAITSLNGKESGYFVQNNEYIERVSSIPFNYLLHLDIKR